MRSACNVVEKEEVEEEKMCHQRNLEKITNT